ncbi:MAG: hypothetical protein EWV85_01285 [Microcystis aeruginosa Ma_QC_C_20070703_M131]|uniref:Uncharacterized protein n=1 Tax=Microcystis aeruginosa Ma_QC_C_20070703_M131 TaxID=2486263 RepID=A0A551YM92_MICAE|nr:MAG: hypothetical protein EWV85_01285 [Microcystis aeruginosa Ma_QC_C_20070703_M131]
MAQVFTRSYVQNLQSNLSIKIGQDFASTHKTLTEHQDYYFQLLIFKELKSPPKLVYGTKENLKNHFKMKEDFPTPGVEIEQDFLPKRQYNDDSLFPFEYGSMIHWLLQTRKLSQMIAYTWVNPENILDNETKTRVSLVKKILDFPSMELEIQCVTNNGIEDCENGLDDLLNKIPGIQLFSHGKDPFSSFLISPDHISFEFIALALLLCGQAFYKTKINEEPEYVRIWEPIADIRQLIMELGIGVSWDTFYGTITDLSEVGKKSQNPYKKAMIPYPPRPSEFSLSQEDIKNWAEAPDKDGQYPFYPRKITDPNEWDTQFVNPPTPYIPLSCL